MKTITSAAVAVTTTQVISTITNASPTASATSSATSTSANANSDSNKSSTSGYWHSTGKVVGTFVPVGLVILALMLALIYFFCVKRYMGEHEDEEQTILNSPDNSINMVHAQDEKNIPTMATNQFQTNTDERLDPVSMMHWQTAGSRQSLADDVDYSRRVLRVTNV